MSWNDFENGSSESKRTLQTIGCCTMIMLQLTQRFQLENFWQRKKFPHFHILERLQKRVQRVRTDIADDWVLHHDNAPAHTALSIREFLAKKNIPALPHPPYSPDLAPCDFYLFPKLKLKLKGHHFGTMENCNR